MKLWIVLTLIGSLSVLQTAAFAKEAHGVFRVVKGQVQIKSAQTGKVSRARIGLRVLPGDVITASKDSRAKVVMIDHNEININPESQVKIEKYEYNPDQGKKNVLLNVIYGKVRSKVQQKYDGRTSKFQVKTPSAVAGVRGTNFITGYEPSTGVSQVVTFRGKVEFGMIGPNGTILNPVAVTAGQIAEISKGGSVIHKEVPTKDFNKMDEDSKAESGSDNKETTNASPANQTEAKKEDGGQKSDRQPSSTHGGMAGPEDLASAPGNLPPPPSSNTMPPLRPIDGCGQNCRDAIQTGNAHLIINVNNDNGAD